MTAPRRSSRVVAPVLVLVLCALPLVLAAPPASAERTSEPMTDPAPVVAEGCEAASEESPIQVEVTTLLPRAPARADQPFQVAGRLRNCGDESLEDLEVRLTTGRVIRTRGELQRADEEPVVGRRRVLTQAAADGRLAPGGTTTFDLRLLVGDLRLTGGLGVYPIALQARARYGEDASVTPVGLATTFVPWFPDGPPARTRVAWLWPLVDKPRRAPAEVMLDNVLHELLAPGDEDTPRGRLQELLVAAREGAKGACDPTATPPEGTPRDPSQGCRGEPVPVTYGIDPSLLYSVEAMTRPYSVLEDGEAVDHPASEHAEQWIAALRDAAQDSDVLALPFGDPDVVAMTRVGSTLRDDAEQLRKLGQTEVRRLLRTEPLTSVAWPPPGPLTSSALEVLVGGQATSVVLDPDALPPPPVSRSRTPSTRTELPSQFGKVAGLVVEDVLSELVTPETVGWQGPRLAEQRFIAETAIIAAEVPSEARTLLIAPDRTADVVPAVGAAVLADTGRLPWLCPVPLADVAAGRERCAGVPDAPGPAEPETRNPADDEPEDERDGELSPVFLERLAVVRQATEQFTEAILVDGTDEATATKSRLLRATGRAASAAWRDEPVEGRRMLDLLEDDVSYHLGQVRLVSEPVTLTGTSGVLLLSVQNSLDQPVNVGIRLDETSAARLSSSATGVQVIPPRRALQVPIDVEPRTSGRFVVLATLVDEDGRPFGDPVRLDVRSTGYGRLALAVTGIGAAVLMVAAGLRITRRAMRRPSGDSA